MKVLCVNNPKLGTPECPDPQEGEEYTVSDEKTINNKRYLLIDELQTPDNINWYHESLFAPTGGPDETEIMEEVMGNMFIAKQNKKFVSDLNPAGLKQCMT